MKPLFLLLYLTSITSDWGATGHRVIGEVAAQHISKKTAKVIDDLLEGASLAYVSVFADDIKSDDRYQAFFSWHFANINIDEIYNSSSKNPKGDVVQAVKISVRKLKSKTTPRAEKQFYLKLLIHFIGDLHQPMHLAKKEDKGENKIKIKWFGKSSNLHRLWDSDMINSSQFSYSELAQNLPSITPKALEQMKSSSFSFWISETHELTKKVYQELPKKPNLGYKYQYDKFDLLRLQLLRAGVRLAALLEDFFK